MKKLLSALLAMICILGLCSCDTQTEKNVWFSHEILEACSVPALPEITDRDYYYEQIRVNDLTQADVIYFTASRGELESYAKVVYEYLSSLGFDYLGTRGGKKHALGGIAFVTWYYEEADVFDDFYTQMYSYNYVFVYSDRYDSDTGRVIFNEIIITNVDTAELSYKREQISYNAKITIRHDASYDFNEYD